MSKYSLRKIIASEKIAMLHEIIQWQILSRNISDHLTSWLPFHSQSILLNPLLDQQMSNFRVFAYSTGVIYDHSKAQYASCLWFFWGLSTPNID